MVRDIQLHDRLKFQVRGDAMNVFNLTNLQFEVVTNVVMLTNNLVSVVTDPADSVGDNVGSNFLALANGTITKIPAC